MQILEAGSLAPMFVSQDQNNTPLDLAAALQKSPVLLVFAHPAINASRLVVGYLRRWAEIAPGVPVWVLSEGRLEETKKYIGEGDNTYLKMPVAHDNCAVATLYGVSYLPTVYLIGQDGKIIRGYSGFNRDFMNWVAAEAARLTGGKTKDLIAESDNKGFYELAERGPCA
ncbi:MAG: peroxiredoxin family protein [Deinococcales bacterium]